MNRQPPPPFPLRLLELSYSALRAAQVNPPSSSNSYSRVLLRLSGALTCETFHVCQYQMGVALEVVRAGHNGPCSPCLSDPSRTASGLPLGWKRMSARVLPRQHRGVVGQCQPQLDISPGPDKLKKRAAGAARPQDWPGFWADVLIYQFVSGHRLPGNSHGTPQFPCGKGVCVVGSPQDRCR